jgi:hypothetical protein
MSAAIVAMRASETANGESDPMSDDRRTGLSPEDLDALAERLAGRMTLPPDPEAVAERVAQATVKAVMARLGIDTDSPEKMNEAHQDMTFVRDSRKRCETISRQVILVVIGAGAAAALAMLWEGFRMALERRP